MGCLRMGGFWCGIVTGIPMSCFLMEHSSLIHCGLERTYAFCDISFPDSAEVHTSFDYRQGDYLYDQLNLHADFSRPERIMKWNGFKRSYGGPFSQFIQPQTGNKSTRALTPNQQSYSFYYLSKMNKRISAAGSNVPNASALRGSTIILVPCV